MSTKINLRHKKFTRKSLPQRSRNFRVVGISAIWSSLDVAPKAPEIQLKLKHWKERKCFLKFFYCFLELERVRQGEYDGGREREKKEGIGDWSIFCIRVFLLGKNLQTSSCAVQIPTLKIVMFSPVRVKGNSKNRMTEKNPWIMELESLRIQWRKMGGRI